MTTTNAGRRTKPKEERDDPAAAPTAEASERWLLTLHPAKDPGDYWVLEFDAAPSSDKDLESGLVTITGIFNGAKRTVEIIPGNLAFWDLAQVQPYPSPQHTR